MPIIMLIYEIIDFQYLDNLFFFFIKKSILLRYRRFIAYIQWIITGQTYLCGTDRNDIKRHVRRRDRRHRFYE